MPDYQLDKSLLQNHQLKREGDVLSNPLWFSHGSDFLFWLDQRLFQPIQIFSATVEITIEVVFTKVRSFSGYKVQAFPFVPIARTIFDILYGRLLVFNAQTDHVFRYTFYQITEISATSTLYEIPGSRRTEQLCVWCSDFKYGFISVVIGELMLVNTKPKIVLQIFQNKNEAHVICCHPGKLLSFKLK